MFYLYIFIFLVAIVALAAGSGMTARSLLKLGRVTGVGDSVLFFIMITIITGIPEIFIALAAAITGNPLISVGNIIGANLANLTLGVGLVAYMSGKLEIINPVSKRVFWSSLILSILPAILISAGSISRFDGLLLIGIGLTYLAVFYRDDNFLERSKPHLPYSVHYFKEIYLDFSGLLAGLTLLIFSSVFIVIFGTSLGNFLTLDVITFSALFLGLATAMPEIIFGVRGATYRHPSLSIGAILGGAVFNATAIIGALAVVAPVTVKVAPTPLLLKSSTFTILAFCLLSIFSRTNAKIDRFEGLLLILLYALFFVSVLTL